MAIKSDYILDMVAKFCDAIMAGLAKSRTGDALSAIEDYEGIVAEVLDMDSACALQLSSASLVTMMQLSAVDEALAVYSVYALLRAAEQYDKSGDALGGVRREQAEAIARAYGFPASVTPPEVEEALAARGVSQDFDLNDGR